ncbi:MAG: ABC transporter substrate-binding protein [Chloroflexota bacterium]
MRVTLTRRDFLQLSAASAALGLAQACATPAAPVATQAPAAQPTPVKPAAQVPQVPQVQATAAATAAATQAPAATKAAGTPKKGGTLTAAGTATITEFHAFHPTAGQAPIQLAMWEPLGYYDEQLRLQPALAEKWDISADGKTVTFKLREGVKFHSGREFTSEDVKASVEFASTDPQSTMISMYKLIKKVETPSKYVAVFQFDSLYAGIYDLIDQMFVMDKETLADRSKTAIGTGPFNLDKYIPNDRIEMVPFSGYWQSGKPYLDRYVFRIIPDPSAMVINIESGAVDCVAQPSYVDSVRLKQQGAKYVVDMGPKGSSIYDIGINVTLPQLKDKRVRQAIAWSVDRARFCRTTLQGLVEPTCLMWPKHSWAYFPDLEGKIGYDLDKAKALLKEAGLASGLEFELMASSKRMFGTGDLAQIMAADLAKIGVKAKVNDAETAIYNNRHLAGEIEVITHTYGRANRDPGSLITGAKAWTNFKQGNWTHWENAAWDSLRGELNATLDQEKRKATARKLQEMALDECFTIVVADNPRGWIYGNYVKGFKYTMSNEPFLGEIWLDK